MPYIKLTIQATDQTADHIAEQLAALNALSVSMTDHRDEPLFQEQPEDQPLWQEVDVSALFPHDTSPRVVIAELKSLLGITGALNYKIEKVADEDWVRLTQQYFQAQCYANRLWIKPSWNEEYHDGQVVKIDPGLAFGTGTHPTTHLCAKYLAENPPQQQTVIDYGCGSGILALAALALGAQQVYATDHDPQAIEATQNNANLNDFVNRHNLLILLPQTMPVIKADLVIANILANPLIELAPTLTALCHNKLILSGILEAEIQTVYHAYQNEFELTNAQVKDEWALLELTRLNRSGNH